jgi:hypothetical protein
MIRTLTNTFIGLPNKEVINGPAIRLKEKMK